MRTVAARAASRPLDLLVNNAAIMNIRTRQVTADGFELTMGTNHLGRFALTAQLLPVLERSAAGSPQITSTAPLRWVSPRPHGSPPTISLADSHRPGSGDMKPGLGLGMRLGLSLVPRLACGAAAASPPTGKPFRRAVEVAIPLAGD